MKWSDDYDAVTCSSCVHGVKSYTLGVTSLRLMHPFIGEAVDRFDKASAAAVSGGKCGCPVHVGMVEAAERQDAPGAGCMEWADHHEQQLVVAHAAIDILRERGEKLEEPIFPGVSREEWDNQMRELEQREEVLRRAIADNWHRAGGDYVEVEQFMGHGPRKHHD